jgi:hypothetical protein
VPRFAFNPVILAAEGILIEPQRTYVLPNTNNMMTGIWVRVGDSLNTSNDFTLYAAGGNVYYLKGDERWNVHHVYKMFNSQLSSNRTISVYLRQHTEIRAQIATNAALAVFSI